MTIILTEPTKTLVDLKLYTGDSLNFVRSEVYNVLYNKPPQTIMEVFGEIRRRIDLARMNRPYIHGDYAKLELVQAFERATYRSSYGANAEWKPDTVDWFVDSDTWLFDKITERCNAALDLVLHWACEDTKQRHTSDPGRLHHLLRQRGPVGCPQVWTHHQADLQRWRRRSERLR